MIVFTARADKISAADFHKLFEPRRSALHERCADLWRAAVDGDRARCAELHAEIQALPTILDLEAKRNDVGSFSVAA